MEPVGPQRVICVSNPHKASRNLVLAVLAFVAAVAIVGYRTARNLNVPNEPLLPQYAMADFRDNTYYPVVAFLDGMNPYDPMVMKLHYPINHTFAPYSPLVLLVHLPLGLLPLQTAEFLHFAALTVLIVCLAGLSLQICGLQVTASATLGLAAFLVLSHPGESTLFLGHHSLILVVSAYLAIGYAQTRPGWAAAGLALATMKPTFGIPLLLLLIPSGALRAAILGLGLGGVLTAIPTLVLIRHSGSVDAFFSAFAESYRVFTLFPENYAALSVTRVDTISFVSRLIGTSLGLPGELAISAAMLVIAALSIRRLRWRHEPTARRLAASISCLTIVCCVYHHAYDALILALPLTLLVTGQISPALNGRAIQWVLVALVTVPMINYASTYAVLNAFHVTGRWWLILTSLNGAALTVAWCILVGVAFQPIGKPTGPLD